jgi:UDP-N-acetylglucosamine transferase subunit ALG13
LILVTVGMNPFPFDRLVKAADEMAASIEEPVVIQKGPSTVAPRFARHIDYADPKEWEDLLSSARVVVTHAGVGSILAARVWGKPLVIVPRHAQYGELLFGAEEDQLKLGQALVDAGNAVMVTEQPEPLSGTSLLHAVQQAEQLEPRAIRSKRLVEFMPSLLARIEQERATSRWRVWWSRGRLRGYSRNP